MSEKLYNSAYFNALGLVPPTLRCEFADVSSLSLSFVYFNCVCASACESVRVCVYAGVSAFVCVCVLVYSVWSFHFIVSPRTGWQFYSPALLFGLLACIVTSLRVC